MKTLLRFLSVVLAVVAITVASVILAQATSSYDDFDFVTEELRSSVPLACGTANHSIGWEIYLSRELEESQPDFFTRWTNAQSHGWYLVLEDPPFRGFEVYYGTSPVRIEFITVSGERRLVLRSTSGTDEVYSSLLTRMPYENCQLGLSMSATHHIDSTNEWGFVAEHSSEAKVFVSTLPVIYPSGYDGPVVPSVYQKGAAYVAMGDSFSSGEGNPAFEQGTDTSDNKCHRSSQAYPRLLQYRSHLNLGSMAFVACSGALTSSIKYGGTAIGAFTEPPQASALSSQTEVVTITIGGNDMKFREFAIACILSNCSGSSTVYQESWDIMSDPSRADYLPDLLEEVYQAIADGLTPANTGAKVYVIGYPKVVTHDSWVSTTSSDPWNCLYMTEINAAGAEAIVEKLNDVISTAVDDFDDSRFVYIDPLASNSPFHGHELCRGDGYFYGASVAGLFGGNDVYVFHPNENGQDAYKQIIVDALS